MKRLLFFIATFCLGLSAAAQQPPPDTGAVRFSGLQVWEETTGPQSIQQAVDVFATGKGRPLPSLQNNFGGSRHRFWFQLSLQSAAAQTVFLELKNPFLYEVELYRANGQRLYQSGIDYPFAQRPVADRQFVLPLNLRPGADTFYLMTHRRNDVLRLSFTLYHPETFAQQRVGDALFFGFFFGTLLFIAAFALALQAVLRQGLHAWYAAYILFAGLFVAADNGFGYQWLWPNSPLLQHHVRSFFGPAAFAVQLRFMQGFLGQTATNSRLYPWVRRTVLALVVLLLSLVGYSVADAAGANLTGWPTVAAALFFNGTYLAGIGLVLASTWQMVRRRQQTASVYLLAMLPLVLFLLGLMALRGRLLAVEVDTPKLLAVALLLEIVTLGCGLLLRYRTLQEERERLAAEVADQQRQLLQAQDAERKRIAEDLHDHLGGTLSAVKGMLSASPVAAQTLKEQAALDEAAHDLRFIAHGLMPKAFAQQSLATALAELVQKASAHHKTAFQFVTHGAAVALPKQTELMLFRMANELLQNVMKHAGARQATVQLLYFNDAVQLMVEDDGKGFDTAKAASGIGLKNLYSRAKYINATLCYDSGPEGTTAICTVPLPATH